MILRWLILISLLIVTGCDKAPESDIAMEVHDLDKLSVEVPYELLSGEMVLEKREFFVISNATADPDKLIEFVKNFNLEHPIGTGFKKYALYKRIFYRESNAMPRDYKESHNNYFDIDRLEDHGNDMILVVLWRDYGADIEYEIKQPYDEL